MKFRTELRVPIVRPMLQRPAESPLLQAALRAAAQFGGVGHEPEPPEDRVARARAALAAGPAAVEALEKEDLRALPYVLFSRDGRLEDTALVTAWLARSGVAWRGAPRAIWRHHLLNLLPRSVVSEAIGRWLREWQERLPAGLQAFGDRFNLHDPVAAVDALTDVALRDGTLLECLNAIGLRPELVRLSPLLLAVLGCIGERLSADQSPRWLEHVAALAQGGPALFELPGAPPEVAAAARKRLLEGVVRRQTRDDPAHVSPAAALDFVLSVNGDPRFPPDRWTRTVDSSVIAIVHQWLTRQTMEEFFRIVDRLKTERDDMWRGRRTFWLRYLKHISAVWLIVGRQGQIIARETALAYGGFAPGQGASDTHCGLMMTIGSLVILEMNQNGAALFWTVGEKMPEMYMRYPDHLYSRDDFLRSQAVSWRRLTHQSGWEANFADHIAKATGILVSQR